MFFILSKVLLFLTSPTVWIASLLILSVFLKRSSCKRKVRLISVLLMLIFSNRFLLNETLKLWEEQPLVLEQDSTYQIGIVLGGMSNYNEKINRIAFRNGGDRLFQALSLYYQGKIKKILISGGSGRVLSQKLKEADFIRQYLSELQFPEQDLIIENQSKNTRENALFSKKILESLNLNENYLLITSSFHMRRAKACFTRVGINAEIYPTDWFAHYEAYSPDLIIVPSASALQGWEMLIHEIIGYITYKLVGYC